MALADQLEIYEARLVRSGKDFHFEIELDNLKDPRGAVTLGQCEQYSRKFQEIITDLMENRSPQERAEFVPEDLTDENFTLEVNSAGAERRLKALPEDLERFSTLPLKIKFHTDEALHTEIVRYAGQVEGEGQGTLWKFEYYTPERGSGKKGRRTNNKGASRKNNRKEALEVSPEEIQEVRLYLDF